MDEATITQTATETPAAASAPATSKDVAAQLNEMLGLGSQPTETPATPSTETPAPPAAAAPTETPAAQPSEFKLPSRAKAEAAKAEASGQTEAQKAAARVAELEAKAARAAELEAKIAEFEAAKGDPSKLLQYGKVTPEQLAKLFVEGKLQFQPEPEQPKLDLPPEVQREIEYARQMRERAEAEAAQRQYEADRAEDVAAIATELKAHASKAPLVAALPGAAERILDAVNTLAEQNGGKLPDFQKVLADAEKAVATELKAVAANEGALKFLVSDPDIAAKLRALLGAPQVAPKPGTPVLTNASSAAQPNVTKTARTTAEQLAEINALLAGQV